MERCLKCKKHGLFFQRKYSPIESIVGASEAPVWIIGLNPKGDEGHNDENDIIQLREYFQSKSVHRYFSVFKQVSPGLHKLLGHPNGVAHTDLVKCYSNNFPPKTIQKGSEKEIVANCSEYLKQQIETHKPKIIICNGTPVSRELCELYPPPESKQNPTSYRVQNGKHDFAVVLSGFIGRGMDRYAKLRLGQEIKKYFELYGINPMPEIEDYDIKGSDTAERKKPVARENRAMRSSNPLRNDDVTHFVRKVALLATDGLPDDIKPDGKSQYAAHKQGHRYYHLWYSRQPWKNWQLFYKIEIEPDPSRDTKFCNNALVAIRYSFDKQGKIGDLSVGESESLKNILDNLDIQKGQRLDHRGRQGRIVQVDFGSNELNGDFAETLADTLRRFIEVVTPAVDNFMDERNEEDTDTIRLPAIPLTLTMKFVDKHNEEDA